MEKFSIIKWNEDFDGTLEALNGKRYSGSDAQRLASCYNSNPKYGLALTASVHKALRIYAGSMPGYFVGKKPSSIVCEHTYSDDPTQTPMHVVIEVKMDSSTNEFKFYASFVGGTPESPLVKPDLYIMATKSNPRGFKGTMFLAAVIGFAIRTDTEAANLYKELVPYINMDEDDAEWLKTPKGSSMTNLEKYGEVLATFTDNIYRRISNANGILPKAMLIVPDEQSQIKSLPATYLKQKVTVISGEANFFTNIVGAPVSSKIGGVKAGVEITPEILASTRLYTEEECPYGEIEKKFIPPFDPDSEFMPYEVRLCRQRKTSMKYNSPRSNFLFVGPGGTGKSHSTKNMAYLNGQPRVVLRGFDDMTSIDTIGQYIPNTDEPSMQNPESLDKLRDKMGLPDVIDIMNDLEGSFLRVFHREYDGTMSEGDLIITVFNMVFKEAKKRYSERDYRFIPSPLVRAIERGYLVEFQEVNVIKRQGVVVGLNQILETGKDVFLELPTGQVIHKHPFTTIVFTMNSNYEGTHILNQSVLSRMNCVKIFKNPSVDDLVARAKAEVFDFKDDKLLYKMAETINEINDFLDEKDIKDGCCGQRELNEWARSIAMDMEDLGITEATPEIIIATARETVLNKATQGDGDIEEIAAATLYTKWSCDTALLGEFDDYN